MIGNDVLERECVEDDHDHKSSTTADVRHLLKLLDQAPWLRVNSTTHSSVKTNLPLVWSEVKKR